MEIGVEVSPFVRYLASDFNTDLDLAVMVKALVTDAIKNPRGVSRICLHRDEEAEVQAMLIGMAPNLNFPAHKHLTKSEIIFVLYGKTKIHIDGGAGPIKSDWANSGAMVRIDAGRWHSLEAGQNGVVILELRAGPFNRTDTVFIESAGSDG